MSNFIDADYAAIEARIVNWLAGQEDTLDRFRRYDAATSKEEKHQLDPYRIMAGTIFSIPVRDVDKGQRFVGKQSELACGFQQGPDGYRKGCKKYGVVLPVGLEFKVVKTWRSTHPHVVRMWYALDNAAKEAICKKGTAVNVTPKLMKGESPNTKLPVFQSVKFLCKDVGGMPYLIMRLPSGRRLSYPRPRVVPSKKFETGTTIEFFGNIKGTKWGYIDTFGGRLLENLTQAVAADIMANGAHNAEREGYQIATLIHDQAIAFHGEGQTAERFVELLTDLPPWAAGLPIAAEGGLVPFYRKD